MYWKQLWRRINNSYGPACRQAGRKRARTHMKQHFTTALSDVETLAEAKRCVIDTLAMVRADQHPQLGFVSGIISSDGDKHIHRNIQRLLSYSRQVQQAQSFPIFCAPDVFSPELYERLEIMHMDRHEREREFIDLWRAILESGHVTHVFFTPRWELSSGARDEHETAMRLGLTITYIEAL